MPIFRILCPSHHFSVGAVLFFALIACSGLATAKPLIVLLDYSESMRYACEESKSDYYSLATSYIRDELVKGRAFRISKGMLYGFADEVEQLTSLTRSSDTIVMALERLPKGGRVELSTAVSKLERELSISGINKAKLVVITHLKKNDLEKDAQQLFKELSANGLEINLVNVAGKAQEVRVDPKSFFAKVTEVNCKKTEQPRKEKRGQMEEDAPQQIKEQPLKEKRGQMEEDVAQQIIEILGLSKGQLKYETDLVLDLGIDRMLAFDVLAQICTTHNVETPMRENLTSVKSISDYVKLAPKNNLAKITVRGEKKSPEVKDGLIEVKTVFYGTNRHRTGQSEFTGFFSGDRARKGKISYGKCDVSIPISVHKRGAMESPALGLEMLTDPRKHIVLKSVDELSKTEFYEQIRNKLKLTESNAGEDILVFIHGYNVLFQEAARRTAQIAYDLEFNGVPMFFSWPSDGKLYAYVSDREDVAWSVPHIRQFLMDVVDQSSGKRIHLITHSMGHEGMLRALNTIALMNRGKIDTPLFENVIMAAPDFDAQIFSEQIAPTINHLSKNWTIYASDKDVALNVSAKLRFAPRLGLPLTLVNNVMTIDATGVEVTPWSVPEFHSYFATKQKVIDDIISVLKGKGDGARAIERNTLGGLPYWTIGH